MNQKTGSFPKQFSIDPPSAGTITNPTVPETHELPRAFTSQIILMGTSNTPKSSDLPSSPTPCQFSSNIQTPHPAASLDIISKLKALEKQTKDDLSRQKSLLSSIQSILTTPSCMTRFANWKLALTIQSNGGCHRSDSSSIQRNQPIASLNLLMTRLQVTGALFSELIPMATISSFNFTLMELTLQPDILQQSSSPFSLVTTTVFYDGHFSKVIHLSLRDQLDPLNAWTQTIQPTQKPPFRRPTSFLKIDAFAVALYKFIPHSKLFSETEG